MAVLAIVTALLVLAAPPASAVSIITIADSSGDVGKFTSLALDSNSYPVVSYYDHTNGALKILHCNDPHCAGGDESITSPDTIGVLDLLSSDAGFRTSLALDSGGNPVVAYYDATSDDLKILHCNDPNCAGGDESITSPDTTGDVGKSASLVLDSAGNPVVSYSDATSVDLKILHCNDPNCAGGDESIISPDPSGNTGGHTSLALDSAGHPVVSYVDFSQPEIKILHCNDPNCAGGDESIISPDPSGNTGGHTSLALDSSGHPVVTYSSQGGSGGDLKLLHCNDPNCADGNDSITLPDIESSSVFYTSLELDSSGNPVVSFWNGSPDKLRVVQCNDPNCSGGNESVSEPDSILGGLHTSLALGPDDDPVVSYYREAGALMVLRCTMAECVEGGTISGQVTVLGQAMAGVQVIAELQSDSSFVAETTTSVFGGFQITDLPQGEYIVQFDLDGYIDEWYNDRHSKDAADPITVGIGDPVVDIDADLTKGGAISGSVGDTQSGLSGHHIELYDLAGIKLPAETTTNEDGDYTIDFLIPGSYKVRHVEGGVWYQNKTSHATADTITVGDTGTTSGIDFFVDLTSPAWGETAELTVTTYGETSLDLAWTAAIDNVAVTGYLLRMAESDGTELTGRTATVTGLDPGTSYLFEVLARDGAGNWSEPLSAVLRTARLFLDTQGHLFYNDILWMSGEDITRGCNPPTNDLFCPDNAVTRETMAAFLVRALGLTENAHLGFVDVAPDSTFANDIGKLATAGITKGCNPPANDRFCPKDPVTRETMAAFLVRGLGLTENTHPGFDDVSPSSIFVNDIGRLATAGITRGCNPPANDRFCPLDVVTRGQLAAFLHRALR